MASIRETESETLDGKQEPTPEPLTPAAEAYKLGLTIGSFLNRAFGSLRELERGIKEAGNRE